MHVVDLDVDLDDLESDQRATAARTLEATSWTGIGYSTTMVMSAAACVSPTSTLTPWDLSSALMTLRIAPSARAPPPPSAYTPGTSRAAMPATLATTPSAMVVVPAADSSPAGRGAKERSTREPVAGLGVAGAVVGAVGFRSSAMGFL